MSSAPSGGDVASKGLQRGDIFFLLLHSISMESMSIAELIDCGVRQFITLLRKAKRKLTADEILSVINNVQQLLEDAGRLEILLQYKLESVLHIFNIDKTPSIDDKLHNSSAADWKDVKDVISTDTAKQKDNDGKDENSGNTYAENAQYEQTCATERPEQAFVLGQQADQAEQTSVVESEEQTDHLEQVPAVEFEEQAEQHEQVPAVEPVEQAEQSEQVSAVESEEQAEQSEQVSAVESEEQAELPEQVHTVESVEQAEQPEQVTAVESVEQAGQSEQVSDVESEEQAEQSEQVSDVESEEQAEQSEQVSAAESEECGELTEQICSADIDEETYESEKIASVEIDSSVDQADDFSASEHDKQADQPEHAPVVESAEQAEIPEQPLAVESVEQAEQPEQVPNVEHDQQAVLSEQTPYEDDSAVFSFRFGAIGLVTEYRDPMAGGKTVINSRISALNNSADYIWYSVTKGDAMYVFKALPESITLAYGAHGDNQFVAKGLGQVSLRNRSKVNSFCPGSFQLLINCKNDKNSIDSFSMDITAYKNHLLSHKSGTVRAQESRFTKI